MKTFIQLLNYIKSKTIEKRFASIIYFASTNFVGKKRNTGEDLFEHSYRMFKKCLKSGIYDEIILKSILLHDIIEDCEFTVEEVRIRFGCLVSFIVEGMTGIDENGAKIEKSEYFMRFSDYCSNDRRILFVKLFDSIDNLETLHGLSIEKQQKFIKEKRETYLPIFEKYIQVIPCEISGIYIEKVQELKMLLG